MIVLSLLKALGILVLMLLLAVLFLLVLLLLVPVHYALDGSYEDGRPDGTASLSWLFGSVKGELTWHHGIMISGSIRLFGIKLFTIREAEHERMA